MLPAARVVDQKDYINIGRTRDRFGIIESGACARTTPKTREHKTCVCGAQARVYDVRTDESNGKC